MFLPMKATLAGIIALALLLSFTACSSKADKKAADSKAANERTADGKTPLQLAIEKGDKAAAEKLIAKGAEVNAMENGDTMLQLAALKGQKDIVELLIAKGANLKAINTSHNTTMLHYAGSRPVAELLVAAGLDINAKSYQGTPLHKAAERGNADVVEYLISLGADPFVEANGLTALNVASTAEVAQLLVSKGLDPNGKPDQNGRCIPPLYTAAQRGHADVVKVLLEKGVDLGSKEYESNNPLYAAVSQGNVETVELLMARGATLPHRGDAADSLLVTAVRCGHQKVVQALLAKGADPNQGSNPPLTIAASKGDRGMLEILVAHGADVRGGNNGWTPLHAAASGTPQKFENVLVVQGNVVPLEKDRGKDYLECAKILVDKGADVSATAQSNLATPLHQAAGAALTPVAELLLSRGAEVNARDKSGATPLHKAVTSGNKSIVEFLISKGADVNAKDEFDATPLHWVVINDSTPGTVPMAQLLLEKGADPNQPLNSKANVQSHRSWSMMRPDSQSSADGGVPLQLAHEKGMKDLLLKFGAKGAPGTTPSTASTPAPAPKSVAAPVPSSRPAKSSTATSTPKISTPPPVAPVKLVLKVTSTNTQSTPPSAVVNGESIEEGKTYDYKDGANTVQYRVVRIESEQIVVSCNGKEEAFPMGSSMDSFMEK